MANSRPNIKPNHGPSPNTKPRLKPSHNSGLDPIANFKKQKNLKVALVCDWLTNVGGAEKVLLRIHQLFPNAPIYTSKYSQKGIKWFEDADVRTGWLQVFPVILRRFLGPLRQLYFSHLDLSSYDLIISVTGAEAKSVKSKNTLHICYCHVPTQYYWQMYDDYLKNPGFGILNPLVRFCFRLLVKPLRRADYQASKRPDYFITISDHAKTQIKKYYHRDAAIIHPPVEVSDFKIGNCQANLPHHLSDSQLRLKNKSIKNQDNSLPQPVENFELSQTFITTSRQVNWKRLDLCIKACLKTNHPLLIIGEGPEHQNLIKLAKGSPLIKFLPLMDKTRLATYLCGAKGYLFPSLEPFGIAPVEALAAGCPVIAYAAGGSLDYIKPGENGVLFKKQTSTSLANAIKKFNDLKFDRQKVSATAEEFSISRFDKELTEFIHEKIN